MGSFPKVKRKIDVTKNQIICGDCKDWLEFVPEKSIDLIYIDPPFYSNRPHEIIWGNGYEKRQFDDRWKGKMEQYIAWMTERIEKAKKVLKDTGSIFLHCDWHASHRLRCMLDDIFGAKNFINEIIWSYRSGGNTKKRFSGKHDNIFWYSKTNSYFFNFEAIAEIRGTKKRNNMRKNKDEAGRVFYSINSNGKTYKYYEDQKLCPSDVFDISHLQQKDPERIGYKTQKPEVLVKRIIECASNEGELVLDFFGGGGTTASCASQLNRKFIIGDVSPVACRVTAERLSNLEPQPVFEWLDLPQTKEEWLSINGHKFAEIMCEFKGWEVNPQKTNDGGIDGWAETPQKQKVPIQVKNQKGKVGRPDLQRFHSAIRRYKEGIFVAWEYSRQAHEFVAEIQRTENKEIKLLSVERDILNGLLVSEKDKEHNIKRHEKPYISKIKKEKAKKETAKTKKIIKGKLKEVEASRSK